jgi:hypothetical protein
MAVVLAVVVVFGILQLGMWMMAGGDVPLLRMHQMKLTTSGSGDHGEDPRSTCHKVSVSSRATTRFIGSKSIFVSDGSLPDLGMAVVHLFFWRCHGGDGGRGWMTFRRGTSFSKGKIVIFLLAVFFVQIYMTRMIISCGDHMCNLYKKIV